MRKFPRFPSFYTTNSIRRQRLLTGREVAYPLSPEQKEDLLERLFLHRDETLAGSFLWNGPSALRFRRVPASAHHGVLEVRKGWHWSGGDRFPHVTMELFAHDVNGYDEVEEIVN